MALLSWMALTETLLKQLQECKKVNILVGLLLLSLKSYDFVTSHISSTVSGNEGTLIQLEDQDFLGKPIKVKRIVATYDLPAGVEIQGISSLVERSLLFHFGINGIVHLDD